MEKTELLLDSRKGRLLKKMNEHSFIIRIKELIAIKWNQF